MASVSMEDYEPVEDVPQEEYYKVAYAEIRLGSMSFWSFEPYCPVFSEGDVETALETVCCKDPKQSDSGKPAAEIPYLTKIGAASYHKGLSDYLTVCFEQDTVTEQQAKDFARTIRWNEGK